MCRFWKYCIAFIACIVALIVLIESQKLLAFMIVLRTLAWFVCIICKLAQCTITTTHYRLQLHGSKHTKHYALQKALWTLHTAHSTHFSSIPYALHSTHWAHWVNLTLLTELSAHSVLEISHYKVKITQYKLHTLDWKLHWWLARWMSLQPLGRYNGSGEFPHNNWPSTITHWSVLVA